MIQSLIVVSSQRNRMTAQCYSTGSHRALIDVNVRARRRYTNSPLERQPRGQQETPVAAGLQLISGTITPLPALFSTADKV